MKKAFAQEVLLPCGATAGPFLDIRPDSGHNNALQPRDAPETPPEVFTLDDLARIIAARADAGAESSYTASLLAKGAREWPAITARSRSVA